MNWVARQRSSHQVLGHFQAGVKKEGSSIAYTVGLEFQRQGYAREALQAILTFLRDELGQQRVRAWIDTRNRASIALVEQLGMREVERIENADHFKGDASHEYIYELYLV